MKKTSKTIAFIDLETTGVDITKDRIVQIAVVKQTPDGKREKKCLLINPQIPIPKESTEVHKITDEMVKNSPKFEQIAKSMLQYIDGCIISGYNIMGFDIPLLVEELLRAKVEFSFDDTIFIDAMNIFKKLNPRNLSAFYQQYTGEVLEGAHDALVDTEATADGFYAMLTKEDELTKMDMEELSSFSMMNDNIVDFAGKFTRNDAGVICFNFGKHKSQPVSSEMGFLDWMLNKDFTQDTLNWANRIKRGEVI
jgi:DNA polymerase-3 subunit epsilon